jgi:peptidoglycan/LPS O-acetylase OafA/YrhL
MADHKLEKIEALRGFASLYVFAGHVLLTSLGAIGLLFRFGQEMVMCFFLLSGFVIYYATHHARQKTFGVYFLHRFRRIYPTLLVALLIAYLVAALSGNPQLDWRSLVGNIFMTQDFRLGKPGVMTDTFCGNFPLWSLSYEWWFYLMFFPIYSYVDPKFQLGLVSALSFAGLATYVFHPNQVSLFLLYFILWWTGLEFARTYCGGNRPTFHTQRHSLAILALFCLLVPLFLIFLMPHPRQWSYGLHPILEIRHFTACLIIAVSALIWSAAGWRFFPTLLGWCTLLAPISYALYAFHYPICVSSRGIDPGLPWVVRLLLTVSITIGLAYLVEVHLQRAVVRSTNLLFFPKKKTSAASTV